MQSNAVNENIMSNKFSVKKRLKSFKHAFNGLLILLREEHNSRIHFLAMIFAVVLGLVLKVASIEWICIVISIGLVISLELVNSAIENLADFASQEKHELIKKTKDLAAAGVFWSSISALVVGLLIFLPKIIKLF